MSVRFFLIIASGFLAIFSNIPLYLNVHKSATIGNPWLFTFQLITMIFAIYLLLLTLISFITIPQRFRKKPQKCSFKLLKIICILSLLFSGISCYFIYFYQIVIDKHAILNMVETNTKEALELFSLNMILFFSIFVAFPMYLFIRYFCISKSFKSLKPLEELEGNKSKSFVIKILQTRALHFLISITIITLHFMFSYQSFASNFRNNRAFLHQITPLNVFVATPIFIYNQYFKNELPLMKVEVSKDKYEQLINQSDTKKPPLFLWVVGETARSDYFSLNGHSFLTNPELTKIKGELLNLKHDTSCDTYTKGSLPCLFSPFDRKEFKSRTVEYPSLPQLMDKSGFQTVWIDNQSGCKGVCEHTLTYEINQLKISELKKIVAHSSQQLEDVCRIPKNFKDTDTLQKFNGDQEFGECGDEIMLLFLKLLIDTKKLDSQKPTIVFLHQMGSHGPSYYKRVPEHFKQQKMIEKKWFLPTCDTDDLTKCANLNIQNSYRNSILYTDYILAKSIDWLKSKQNNFQTAMLYHSDHGESLGENGVYLHGLPYSFAPDSQKNVPIIWWFSEAFKKTFNLTNQCLNAIDKKQNEQLKNKSHEDEHLFHSFLGAFSLETSVYNKEEDIFTSCKNNN